MNDPEETRTLDLRRDRAALQPTEPPGQTIYLFVLYLLFWVVDLQGLEPGTDRL